MREAEIQDFWHAHPCGDELVGGLALYANDYETFFTSYDRFRYSTERHILTCLDGIDFAGKRVLEIGLGQGADAEQIIRRGAKWSGLDLTAASIERVRARLTLRGLPFEELKQGSVLELPFANNSFDIIFSHGVLHHVPEIKRAQSELHRVLKPDGELIVMLYAKWSLNYLFSIGVVRRLGLIALRLAGYNPGGIYGQHLENVKATGLRNYLRMKNFIHRNTDGALNPYSKVYDARAIRQDFPDFKLARTYRHFMHAPPLPVNRLPLGKIIGWHLWAHLKPVGK